MWLKIKIWTKLILIGAVALYSLLFVLNNIGKRAALWFWFGAEPDTPLLVLVLMSFLAGALLTLMIRTIQQTLSQIRALREKTRQLEQQREIEALKMKAAAFNVARPPGGTATPPADPQ
jgi:uncharacterized integral membrane protein